LSTPRGCCATKPTGSKTCASRALHARGLPILHRRAFIICFFLLLLTCVFSSGRGAACVVSLAALQARAAVELQKLRAQRLGALAPLESLGWHGDSAAVAAPAGHGRDPTGGLGGGPSGGRAASAYGAGEVKEVLAHLQRRGLVHLGGGGDSLGGGQDGQDAAQRRRRSQTRSLGLSMDGPSHSANERAPKPKPSSRGNRSPSRRAPTEVAGKFSAAAVAAAHTGGEGDAHGLI
jgi:hypothetical protein